MTSAPAPIRGKVARILSSRELALNIGAKEGVQVGMIFEVLDPRTEDVKDPDTGEVLGSIRRPKIEVKVGRVDERVSLASTFHGTEVNLGGEGTLALSGAVAGFARLFEPPNWVVRYETLKASEHQVDELDEKDSIVKVGDPVVQVFATRAQAQSLP